MEVLEEEGKSEEAKRSEMGEDVKDKREVITREEEETKSQRLRERETESQTDEKPGLRVRLGLHWQAGGGDPRRRFQY